MPEVYSLWCHGGRGQGLSPIVPEEPKAVLLMNWLAPDSKFMRAWSNLVDGVWINLLMLVTSIPLITIGAALTAGHDACRRSIEGEGKGVTANYFKSFKANFIKATLLWLPFLVVLIALVWSWIVLHITPLLIIKFALTILWLIGFEWVFALQARFENTVAGTLKNAFIFGISHIAMTVALVIVDAVFICWRPAGSSCPVDCSCWSSLVTAPC